jgi:two-component system, OmpR family, phosphate regulon sensor histidine kinase PhoR
MKNRTLVYFIAGSLFLLGLLEFLWLQKSYNEQRTDLQHLVQQSLRAVVGQESNAMMLGALRSNPTLDSLFQGGGLRLPFAPSFFKERNGEPGNRFEHDGRRQGDKYDLIPIEDSAKMMIINKLKGKKNRTSIKILMDSTPNNRIEFHQIQLATKNIEPLKGGGRNDIQVILGSDTASFSTPQFGDSMRGNGFSFYSNWNEDSINLERITAALAASFAKSGLPKLPFQLSRIKRGDVVPTERTAIVATARIFDAPHSHSQNKIGIAVYNFEPFLLRKIIAESSFALFVFFITSISFWLVYNNFIKQKQLTAIKNAFISNITHELKTPIATVSVALEALQSFDALENRALTKEYLDISRGELQRLSMLVDKVLKLAIFDEKEPELQLETVNLPDLVRHVADSLRLQFEKNGAVFNLNFDKNVDLTIDADPTHLTSVVYNLLDNALKYGGKKIDIFIHQELINKKEINALINQKNAQKNVENNAQKGVYTEGSSKINSDNILGINLQIKDDGKGISSEYQDKIFDKFFRVPTDDVHDTKGHGLGLSYVAAVVRLHGGNIWVESEEGNGSCFSIFLPINK